jgi:hypothetical protein
MRYWMVFDIETVPDADLGRRWLAADPGLSDAEVRRRMAARRLDETNGQSDFLKPPFHQVCAISAALIDDSGTIRRLGPLGLAQDGEKALVTSFFHVIDQHTPRLVGWNSSGFDIPTLLYRALHHGIVTKGFYTAGEPYHGYRKRYDEESHIDLMDILSGYGASARVSLNEAAALLGVPGKLDLDGGEVKELYESGAIARIRDYCSHDVLTTALVFMHYAFHRGWLEESRLKTFIDSAWHWLNEDEAGTWGPFRHAWTSLGGAAGSA